MQTIYCLLSSNFSLSPQFTDVQNFWITLQYSHSFDTGLKLWSLLGALFILSLCFLHITVLGYVNPTDDLVLCNMNKIKCPDGNSTTKNNVLGKLEITLHVEFHFLEQGLYIRINNYQAAANKLSFKIKE